MALAEFAPDNQLVPSVATLRDDTTGNVYSFPFNINSLTWNYQMNTQSFDTVGGRVTQLLSVRITTMELQGEAGSRKKLMDLYNTFNTIQDQQNLKKVSMTLAVPSRGLSYKVWLNQMQMGWDVTTVTYPYMMTFQMDQDVSSNNGADALQNAAASAALKRLAEGVGYSDYWTGMRMGTGSVTASTLMNSLQPLQQSGQNG